MRRADRQTDVAGRTVAQISCVCSSVACSSFKDIYCLNIDILTWPLRPLYIYVYIMGFFTRLCIIYTWRVAFLSVCIINNVVIRSVSCRSHVLLNPALTRIPLHPSIIIGVTMVTQCSLYVNMLPRVACILVEVNNMLSFECCHQPTPFFALSSPLHSSYAI